MVPVTTVPQFLMFLTPRITPRFASHPDVGLTSVDEAEGEHKEGDTDLG